MCLLHLASLYAPSHSFASRPLPNRIAFGSSGCKCGPSDTKCGPSGCKVGPSVCKVGPSRCKRGLSDVLCVLQAELRQLQPVLEKTAVDVDTMMVRITADKKEAAATQKAVAQQEQEANEQAARVSGKLLLPIQRMMFTPELHTRNISMVQCTGIVSSEWWYNMHFRTAL